MTCTHRVSTSSQPCIPEVTRLALSSEQPAAWHQEEGNYICPQQNNGVRLYAHTSDGCCRGTSPECVSLFQGQQAPGSWCMAIRRCAPLCGRRACPSQRGTDPVGAGQVGWGPHAEAEQGSTLEEGKTSPHKVTGPAQPPPGEGGEMRAVVLGCPFYKRGIRFAVVGGGFLCLG